MSNQQDQLLELALLKREIFVDHSRHFCTPEVVWQDPRPQVSAWSGSWGPKKVPKGIIQQSPGQVRTTQATITVEGKHIFKYGEMWIQSCVLKCVKVKHHL